MLSLSELAQIHKKKLKNKSKAYDVILNKCHTQIRNMARRDQTFCYYMVPTYVLGLPLYDINACIVYILLNLKKRGFFVQMSNAQTIYISWKHIHERPRETPRPRQTQNNWSQQNQRYVQNHQPQQHLITYHRPRENTMRSFIERSRSLL